VPVDLPADTVAEVVARLRAAGCVYAEDEARLLAQAASSVDELAAMVDRRVDGVPLEQVVGWAEFCGLRIAVAPGVFVPRRRTELLARAAAERTHAGSVVVDLCCGSGAVGAAVASLVPDVELYAVDIDAAAVACARRNLVASGGRVYQGDLFRPLPVGLFGSIDVLVVNAPYVPSEEMAFMPPEARLHEPLVALDGGADGLDVHRRVAAGVGQWLAPGGMLLAECSENQAPVLADIYATSGGSTDIELDPEGETAVVMLTSR
jgi:release factor glutamine methyltransferase